MEVERDGYTAVLVTSIQYWIRTAGIALFAAVVLNACGGRGSGGSDPVPPPRTTTITVSPSDLTLEALGATQRLEATARDQNGNIISAQFSYGSSDVSVVTVDTDGLVTAMNNGMATVTVRSEAVSAPVTVTVMQVLDRITLVPDNVTLTAIGERAQLQVMTLDANGVPMAVDFNLSSSDPAIASVNAQALVTAQANGIATITARSGIVSASASVTVDQQVARVSISPADTSNLNAIGATVQLQAIARDANGHAVTVEFDWTSSDPSVASVDGTGVVTAHGNGMTQITVSAGALSDAITIDLSLRQAATVVVTSASSLLEAFGATAQLQAKVLDADGQEIPASVGWASSNPAIAEINASGQITARGNGTATITARIGEVSGAVTVRVLQRIRHTRITHEQQVPHSLLFTSLGETVRFVAEALDPKGHSISGAVFTARSYESRVVSIDDRLLATAIGNGETYLAFTANWAGRSQITSYLVRVRQMAASLDIEPAARTFRTVGETHQFTAEARDANGHPLPADFLYWATADRRIADVDATGLVSIVGVGETTVTVLTPEWFSASAKVSGDLYATCESGDRTPSITVVQPEPLVEGMSFMIDGLGFCGESTGNLVTIDRMAAAVDALSETQLTVTVPQFDCLPSRRVELGVAVGQNRVTRTVELTPDEPVVSVAVGRQAIWGAGEDRCLQFSAAADEEAYLIGVQSTSLEPSSRLTPVRLIASTSEAGAPATAAERQPLFWNAWQNSAPVVPLATADTGLDRTLPDNLAVEDPLATIEVDPLPEVGPTPADSITFPDQGDIESLPEEGDIVTVPHSTVKWVVYKIGTHALWLVDTDFVERMEASYPGRIEELSEGFDDGIYPAVSHFFGAPDLGNIGRVVVTISREDAVAGATSSQGRQWHRITVGLLHGLDIVAHEFIHAVQHAGAWNRPNPPSLAPNWFLEAQAQLGTEQYLLVQSNRTTAQNYGRAIAFDAMNCRTIGWCLNFNRLTQFFGGAHPERPQECSWLLGDSAPCPGAPLFYYVGWSLLRWLSDQYGRMYPGGEANLQRELIHGPDDVTATIEQQMGEHMETLLARWAAAMYVDDRIPNLDPDLQFTSWNFHDIYRNDSDRLIPLEISFSDQEHRARIRDGSFWYIHVFGSQRPSTAIRVRDLAGRKLPDDIQVWIVRLQ